MEKNLSLLIQTGFTWKEIFERVTSSYVSLANLKNKVGTLQYIFKILPLKHLRYSCSNIPGHIYKTKQSQTLCTLNSKHIPTWNIWASEKPVLPALHYESICWELGQIIIPLQGAKQLEFSKVERYRNSKQHFHIARWLTLSTNIRRDQKTLLRMLSWQHYNTSLLCPTKDKQIVKDKATLAAGWKSVSDRTLEWS